MQFEWKPLEDVLREAEALFRKEHVPREEFLLKVREISELELHPAGSTVRVDSTPANDIDLIVVLDKLEEGKIHEASKLLSKYNPPRTLHLLFLTPHYIEVMNETSDMRKPYKLFKIRELKYLAKDVWKLERRLREEEGKKVWIWTPNHLSPSAFYNTCTFSIPLNGNQPLAELLDKKKALGGIEAHARAFFDTKVDPTVYVSLYSRPRLFYEGLLKACRTKLLKEGKTFKGNLIQLKKERELTQKYDVLVGKVLQLRVNGEHVPKRVLKEVRRAYVKCCEELLDAH
mgnify:CR=1 FL=1